VRQLYYFTYDQFTDDQLSLRSMKKIAFARHCEKRTATSGSRIRDCKELLPVVLRISKQLEKVYATASQA
jgi:hypothetical protein